MKDDADFLRALAASPKDATLRRAYADWLEERGDPRHELVHVCEAMRAAPVWSDCYWDLKGRRNELLAACPVEWLEATGYDGSYYDPLFRDGVPDDWRGRWRLVREFIERWRGEPVGDAGRWGPEVRAEEERLGLELPPSVREYVALAHELGEAPRPNGRFPTRRLLFHCALYRLDHLPSQGISLINHTLADAFSGVVYDDLGRADPATSYFGRAEDDVEFDEAGVPTHVLVHAVPQPYGPSLTQSIFLNLFLELPTAGEMSTTLTHPEEFLARLARDFPIHARFDDADVYEADELLVVVHGATRPREGHFVRVVLRRPVPVESIPDYQFGTGARDTMSSGLLAPERYRRQQEEEQRRPGAPLWPRWVSVVRRLEGAGPGPGTGPLRDPDPRPLPGLPDPVEGDIPF
jgi:uncharacterized protein (TIGR02996 family)